MIEDILNLDASVSFVSFHILCCNIKILQNIESYQSKTFVCTQMWVRHARITEGGGLRPPP